MPAVVEARKSFPVETIATGLTGKGPPVRGGGGGILPPPRTKCSDETAWFCSKSAQSCGVKLAAEIPSRLFLGCCPVGVSCPRSSVAPHQGEFRRRELGERPPPHKAKVADLCVQLVDPSLRRQSSARMAFLLRPKNCTQVEDMSPEAGFSGDFPAPSTAPPHP